MYVIFPAANGENNRTSSLRFAASTGEVSYVRENVQLPERKLMLNLSWMRRYEKKYVYIYICMCMHTLPESKSAHLLAYTMTQKANIGDVQFYISAVT